MTEFNPNLKIQPYELAQMQSLPLSAKVVKTQMRIKEWYEHWQGQVYIAFSGGKDSTVLAHLVRDMYPEVPCVFINTGNEYPEIVKFVRDFTNVIWLRPKYTVKEVFDKYGYPVVSKEQSRYLHDVSVKTTSQALRDKRLQKSGYGTISKKWRFLIDAPFHVSDQCCYHLKKAPTIRYEKSSGRKPIMGIMAIDSQMRKSVYLVHGCNIIDSHRPRSWPISFWSDENVWEFIRSNQIPYSSIYDMGYSSTGCVACGFGLHMQKPNRIQMLHNTHPKLWTYCMDYLGLRDVLQYMNIPVE